jgi:hypothetical protein
MSKRTADVPRGMRAAREGVMMFFPLFASERCGTSTERSTGVPVRF